MLLIYDLCDNILNVNIWCFGGRTLENEQQQIKENIENKRPGNIQVEPRKKLNKGLIITAIVLSVIAIAMVVFALVNKLNTNVYSNVYSQLQPETYWIRKFQWDPAIVFSWVLQVMVIDTKPCKPLA